MKTLEEKIAGLHPVLRVEVEDFIDYLLFKQSQYAAGDLQETERSDYQTRTKTQVADDPSRLSTPGVQPYDSDESGIIWADERPVNKNQGMDQIDFADINTRFSQEQKDTSGPDSDKPKKLREGFDWL